MPETVKVPLERARAERCAERVNQYWWSRGFHARARVEERAPPGVGANDYAPVFAVASDLVNGLPPGFPPGRSIHEVIAR